MTCARAGDYELVGEGGKKNGEKRLRAQLCKSVEWNSGEERSRLAALCVTRAQSASPGSATAVSMTRLAASLRAKRSAALAKGHLMFCARAWGYQSEVWYRHGRATRAREAAAEAAAARATPVTAAAAAAPVAQEATSSEHDDNDGGGDDDAAVAPFAPPSAAELRLSGGGFPWDVGFNVRTLTAADAAAEVERQLRPLALAATALLAGPDARAATVELGACFIGAHDLVEVRKAATHTGYFARSAVELRDTLALEYAAAAEAAELAASSSSSSVPVPAWRHLAGRDTALEARLRTVGARLRRAALNNCPAGFFSAPHVLDALRSGAPEHSTLWPTCELDGDADAPGGGVAAESSGGDHLAVIATHDPLRAAQARWLNEVFRGLCAAVELLTRLQLLVADAKFAPHVVYCDVALHVADTLALFTQSTSDAFTARAGWMVEEMARQQERQRAGEAAPCANQAAHAHAQPRLLFSFLSACGGCEC
jgi:hypothetical protein